MKISELKKVLDSFQDTDEVKTLSIKEGVVNISVEETINTVPGVDLKHRKDWDKLKKGDKINLYNNKRLLYEEVIFIKLHSFHNKLRFSKGSSNMVANLTSGYSFIKA